MAKYKYICIDFNNLFWRSITSCLEKTLLVEEHIIYNISITNFLDRIKQLILRFGYDESIIYFLCDNPESHINVRKIISNGEYKHSRESKNLPKNIYKTLNILLDILKNYDDNFRIVNCDHLEADDLTYPIRKQLELNENIKCLYISADLDWARNIDKYCNWFNFFTVHNFITFKNKYGFSPVGKSIQLMKAIKGDNSDCIVNAVPYLPKEILNDILNKFKDIDDLYDNLWKQDYSNKWKIKLKEKEVNVRLNYQLVDFILLEDSIDNYIYKCKKNLKKLNFWFDVLSIPQYDSIEKKKSYFKRKRYKRI